VGCPGPTERNPDFLTFKFCTHTAKFYQKAKKQKTYGRFLGMIFLEPLKSLVIPALQWIAYHKSIQNSNNIKKCLFWTT